MAAQTARIPDRPVWGLRRWIYSTNHKDIGTMYLAFAIIGGLVGSALSIAMRLELQEPGLQVFSNGHAYNVIVAGHGHGQFGAAGYPRLLDDPAADAAVTFLAAPIGPAGADDAVLSAMARAQAEMSRPAGGVAPGVGWKDDGISWTPETALFAAAWAASGHRDRAEELLGWLGAHRTDAGSFPEKVLYDGRPAAVAPLAWTAALVVIARHELVHG